MQAQSIAATMASAAAAPAVAGIATRRRAPRLARPRTVTVKEPSTIRGAPLGAVFQPQVHQPLEQLRVGCARGARRLGEVLGSLEIRVGVGFEHVHLALGGYPEVHASIT